MKCRRIDATTGNIIWFGVKEVSKDAEGNNVAIFENTTDKHDNYIGGSEGVANSLRQRLSILKNELWYDYANGIPLIDKVKSKSIIDAYIIQTVLKHPDVIDIEGFESMQENHAYSCYLIINTIHGQIELGL